jgi:hypothetical protein
MKRIFWLVLLRDTLMSMIALIDQLLNDNETSFLACTFDTMRWLRTTNI